MPIYTLLHLKVMIEQLRRMRHMSISDREQWAIDETLAQVYERASHLLYSSILEREKGRERKLSSSLPLPFSLSNSPVSPLATHRSWKKERLTPIIYRFFCLANVSDTKPITERTHYKAPQRGPRLSVGPPFRDHGSCAENLKAKK